MRGDSTELFSRTAPGRLFFIAALPGAVSMLASALYQLLDGIFVGHYLGDTPFAALNLAMPFVIINFALADLIGVGSAVPISVNLGRGERREADNIFTCASLLIVLSGVMMQFVNVKGILFSVTAMASYVLPNWSGPLAIALCSAIIACCCVVCCGVWALGGAALVGAYRKHARLISGVMALALVWCALSLLLELARRLF